ncbi:VOC family protein [Kribbella sp. HUAS MG21]|uniref:VOC family protein n=1 Tax=Kribbella sp. HUAS MG21 TaxID=3160966 RepID=A0AAU7T6S6_9ACTN
MDWKLELLVVPVSDVDRAKKFYTEQLGFAVDVDHQAGPDFRVVQLTPPGSACSISIGIGLTTAAPGSYQATHLVVNDIVAARAQLVEHGVDVSEPFHFTAQGKQGGLDPNRGKYGTYLTFEDPDGNGWIVQEVPDGAPEPTPPA